MRILHLLEASSQQGLPDGALAAVALLQRCDTENEHLLVCFAPLSEIGRARHFGVNVGARFGAGANRRRSASIVLRRHLEQTGPIDRIQPWSSMTADLAYATRDLAETAPPLPRKAPIIPEHCSARSRLRWRQRFELGDKELAITLLDLDRRVSSAGAFGLVIGPLTCAMQDRTFVGLISSHENKDGATRAKRYANNAGDLWRIELVSAPRFATTIAADVILCPTRSIDSDPWDRYSSSQYALACAIAGKVQVVAGSFEQQEDAIFESEPGVVSAKPGRVGVATALIDASIACGAPGGESFSEFGDHCPDLWISRWRESLGATVHC